MQLGLFDQRNLFELSSPDYPNERLVACRNPQLAQMRAHKREELLADTETNLQKVQDRVDAGKLTGADQIGLRVGKVVNQYKVGKHFALDVGARSLTFARKADGIAAEAALDGIYIIRHRTADRVRAHIFLCMLAYYVEWHMREAWRELMFADPEQQAKARRDPVAPAKRSQAALAKVANHSLDDGTPAHSFATLMEELAGIVSNTCRTPHAGPEAPTFSILTTPNPKQRRALELIDQIRL